MKRKEKSKLQTENVVVFCGTTINDHVYMEEEDEEKVGEKIYLDFFTLHTPVIQFNNKHKKRKLKSESEGKNDYIKRRKKKIYDREKFKNGCGHYEWVIIPGGVLAEEEISQQRIKDSDSSAGAVGTAILKESLALTSSVGIIVSGNSSVPEPEIEPVLLILLPTGGGERIFGCGTSSFFSASFSCLD